MKRLWNILANTWYGNIALGLIAALVFYYVILAGILQTNTPVVAVVSNSMQHDNPEITHYKWLEENLNYDRSYVDSWPVKDGFSKGDMPIIKGEKAYKIGDVIVYDVKGIGAPIIHRIIKINSDGSYQTKGDNNYSQNTYESSVKLSQIKGRVIFIIPKVGYFKVLTNQLFGV